MDRHPLLIETGCEDLPPADVSFIRDCGAAVFSGILKEKRIEFSGVRIFVTPRRIAVFAKTAARQNPEVEKIKGPPYSIAVKDGKPAPPGTGFAQKLGVRFSDLETEETPKGKYLTYTVRRAGSPVRGLVGEITSEFLSSLKFPAVMSWPGCPFRFPRPIRWVLAISGNTSVKFELGGLRSGRTTRGHYLFSDKKIRVTDPAEYEKLLEMNYVIPDPLKRTSYIKAAAERALQYTGGSPVLDEKLLEELGSSLEFPTAVKGSFPEKYLKIPREIIEACLIYHQRYFPVNDAEGSLLNCFIGIRDGISQGLETIRKGYEKVLVARLEDAEFFLHKDRERPLADYAKKLGGIEFTRGLGTLYDKALRVKELTALLCAEIGAPPETAAEAEKIALLCKADLTTLMVGEFPELEGTVGKIYAAMDGESSNVSEGIIQHYLPKTSVDGIPSLDAAAAVGLCDRIDTLFGNIASGVEATGSQDPFGLRRTCRGMLRIAVEKKWPVAFNDLSEKAAAGYDRFPAEASEKVNSFIAQQALQFAEDSFPYDVARCAAEAGVLNPYLLFARAAAVEKIKKSPGFDSLITAFKRAGNILKQASENGIDVPVRHDPDKLREASEKELSRFFGKISGEVRKKIGSRDYYAAIELLSTLREPVDLFFEEVLVMDPDKNLMKNRLSLLGEIAGLVSPIGDISLLEVKG